MKSEAISKTFWSSSNAESLSKNFSDIGFESFEFCGSVCCVEALITVVLCCVGRGYHGQFILFSNGKISFGVAVGEIDFIGNAFKLV